MKLTKKQKLFCDEYLIDLNATQAAIRAGYSKKSAESQGSRLLTNGKVVEYLAGKMAKRSEKVKVDADYVLNRLVEIDKMDLMDILDEDGSIKDVSRWPKVWRQFLSGIDVSELFAGRGDQKKMVGIVKKIKWPDKVKNLEMIGKHIGVGAFKDVKDVKHSFLGADGKPMDLKAKVTFVLPGEVDKE